ncbi:Hypothetical predicted protein, partial [Mytilus galloprovincialis]
MDAYFHIPNFSQVSSFPETGLGRQGLQFQGYAFWPGYCTPSFYQDFSDGGVLSSYSGSTHSLLPRRFSYQESLPISFGGTHQFVYPFTPETGFFDFMGKIRDNSQSEFQFPGRTFSDRSAFKVQLFLTQFSLFVNFQLVAWLLPHLQWWLQEKTSSEGSFVGSSRPQPNFVHRCESDGLGSLSGGQDSIRPLVRCSVGGTHQSARDESCVSFSPSVSGCDSGSVTTGCHGQLHSSGLSSESRGDPFLFSVSSEQGNSSSVSQSRYNSVSETCSRQSKSSGGCSLPFPCSSEHRMGNSSISVSGDHSLLGSSSYRSFCHQSESQVGDLQPVTTVTITPSRDSNMIDVIDGDSQSFSCTTGLSRPAAWIQWYIGSQNVTNQAQPQTPQPDGDKFISSSTMVYTGKDADHKKSIYCEAINIEGRNKVKSNETSIFIQIPLTRVTITPAVINNSADVVVGDTRTFSCSTGLSRPAARIQWYIGGDNVTNQAQPQTPHPDGDKFISYSTMMYTGKDEDHNNNIYCEAVNTEKRDKVKSIEITLNLEIPPTALTITPLADNNVFGIMKGDTETLNCTTNSCRPAARIHWYIGTLNVTNHAQQQTQQLDGDKFVSSSRLVYHGKDADHNKTIYCEAVTVEGKYKVKSRIQFIYIFREPIPPSYIYVVCKSTTAIVILKLIENGMVADDLYIQYTAGGQNMTSIKLHIIDTMHHIEYTVTGLYPGKHYNFSVLASNPFGETSSKQIECETDT